MTHKLQTTVTVETAEDLSKAFRSDLGVEYDFHSQVRWWQCWRWHWLVREDYQLSRAAEIILVRKMSDSMRDAIASDLIDSLNEASDMIYHAQETERARERAAGEPERCVNCGNILMLGVCTECGLGV